MSKGSQRPEDSSARAKKIGAAVRRCDDRSDAGNYTRIKIKPQITAGDFDPADDVIESGIGSWIVNARQKFNCAYPNCLTEQTGGNQQMSFEMRFRVDISVARYAAADTAIIGSVPAAHCSSSSPRIRK